MQRLDAEEEAAEEEARKEKEEGEADPELDPFGLNSLIEAPKPVARRRRPPPPPPPPPPVSKSLAPSITPVTTSAWSTIEV